MEIWFSLSIIAAVLWAVGIVLVKKGFENISPLWTNIISYSVRLFIWIPTVLFLSNFQLSSISAKNLLIITLAAVGYTTLHYALSKGKVALSGTVVSLYPIFTIVLAYLFLGEKLSLTQLFGVLVVMIASLFLALPNNLDIKSIKNIDWFWWGALAALSIGTADFITKFSTNEIGAYTNIFYLAIISLLLTIPLYLIDVNGRSLPKFSLKKFFPTTLGNIILWTGSLLFFLAFDYGDVSLITPVSATYPAIMVLLAMIFLKEKLFRNQVVGVILAITGVLFVSLG